jgi:hypothetical protein
MTDPSTKIKSKKIIYADADGNPTDKEHAVSAEVVTTYEDGSVSHNLLRKSAPAGR